MRTCGECVVCCVYPRIEEPLHKDPMTHCVHAMTDEPEIPGERVCYTGTGCRTYEDRPKVCREYKCAWLAGHGEDEDRPDRSGVLIDRSKGIKNGVECKSLWEGACDDTPGRRAVARISEACGMAALILSFGERRLVEVRT